MNLKFEIALLVLGGVLRALGVGVNIWYFFTQNFGYTLLWYFCGAFLLAPSAIFLSITIVLVLLDTCNCKYRKALFKLTLGLMITIGGPLGVPLFVYAVLLAMSESLTGDFYIIEGLSRATSLVECLFESLPQFGVQLYNNLILHDWNWLKVCSILISILSIVYTGYKLCYAVDKIQQYEIASAMDKTANIESKVSDRKMEIEVSQL